MKKIIVSIIATLTVLLSGCGKPVPLNVKLKEAQPRINIFGRLDDNTWTEDHIMVRKSVSYLHPADSVYISDATVSVRDESGQIWVFTYDPHGQGIYNPPADYTGIKVGTKYTLEVLYNGIVYAASSIADPLRSDSTINTFAKYTVAKRTNKNSFGDTTGYVLSLFLKDDPKIKNYYYMNIYKNGWLVTATDPDANRTSVYTFDDKYLNVTDEPIENTLFEKFALNDTVKIDLFEIDFATYTYYQDLDTQTNNSGSIFDGPPANIVGNISNGALGYFYVSSSLSDTLTVKLQ